MQQICDGSGAKDRKSKSMKPLFTGYDRHSCSNPARGMSVGRLTCLSVLNPGMISWLSELPDTGLRGVARGAQWCQLRPEKKAVLNGGVA
jgi:hypothetical protein